jgi:hypothetical protein
VRLTRESEVEAATPAGGARLTTSVDDAVRVIAPDTPLTDKEVA